MNKTLFIIITILTILSSLTMYYLGKNSSHLSELKDFFWIPFPIGVGVITSIISINKIKN